MSELNLNRVEAMLAHLKARGITVAVNGGQFRLQAPAGDIHDNDVAALRALLQALGVTTENALPEIRHAVASFSGAPASLLEEVIAVPALVDPHSPARGNTLSLPLVPRDVEVLRHKAGAWFSSTLGVGATLFAILLSRYQQKEDWLRELGVAIAQQPAPGEAPRAWFALAPLLRHLPADGSLREVVGGVAEHLAEAAVSSGDSLDLALALPDLHDEDQLVWHFAGDLFDEAFVRQLHADFVAIMRQATALITPMLSSISLYGAAVSAPPLSSAGDAPVASVDTRPAENRLPEQAPGETGLRETGLRENNALWRTVQAVIDGHVNTTAAVGPAPEVAAEGMRYPLSPQQWAFVLDEQKFGAGARHNVTAACFVAAGGGLARSSGVIDLDRAQKALSLLMKRHALLRTIFEWQTAPELQMPVVPGAQPAVAAQTVLPAPPAPWRALVVSTTDDLQQAARQWLQEASLQSLGLFAGLPWLASVATVSNGIESAAVWRLTLHNAVADQETADRWMLEWQALYAGEVLAPVGEAYAEYTQRQLGRFGPALQLDAHSDAWAFWGEQLRAVRPVHWPLLPATLASPPAVDARGESAPAGGTHPFVIDAELMQKIRVAALGWQVSPDSLLLTAFATLLRRYADQDLFVIGVEFANRQADVESLAGVTTNVLPFVVQLDEGRHSVRHRVEQTQGQLADMSLYQSTPLISVLPLLAAHRGDAAGAPINFVFTCRSELSDAARQLVGRGLQPLAVSRRQPRVALGLNVRCSELQASEGELEFYSDWLSADAAAEFIDQYFHLLGGMVSDAGAALNQLPLLSLGRQQEMFDLFNRDAQSLPSFLPHFTMWWQRQCYSAPQNLAVVAAEGRMNFAELDALANQIARYLVSQQIGPGDRVGLLLPRDPVLLATVLAVFKVGAAWVPIHATWPQAYQESVLAQAGVSCVLYDSERMPWQGTRKALDFSIAATPWHSLPSDGFEDADDPAALACIIYPREITPVPQGVTVCHRNLSALVAWGVRQYENRPPLRAAFTGDLCSENALYELFVTLCSGGAVVLMDDLISPLARERPTSSAAKLLGVVNHVSITPTLAGEMLRGGWLPKGLRTITLIGEPASVALRDALLAVPGISDVLVLHACAENCGVAFVASFGEHAKPAHWRQSRAANIGVGAPIDGTQCVILSAQGQLQPWGIAGDLYIGGAALSQGYWPPPENHSSRFSKNPLTYFPTLGNTLFHTGYRACWHADGRIELLSVVAEQASHMAVTGDRLRAEQCIQQALGGIPAALCPVRNALTGALVRVAFVQGELPARHYLQTLQRVLPPALQPDVVTVVGHWPRDDAHQLDRAALALQYVDGRAPTADAAPNTLELQMLRVWQELLGERVRDIDTDFFAAGGHSLLAVQLAVQLAQRYALHRVPAFTTLMQYPTPRRLARWLDAALRGEESRATLWEPLSTRVADRSLLVFQSVIEAGNAVAWPQVAQALPDSIATFRVSAQWRENDDTATLVQRYVDAIEQECLPLPAALAGEGAGAVLAVAVAREMHARGWPWLPVMLLDGITPHPLAPVQSRTLHVNGPRLGVAGRAGWPSVLQGEVQWRLAATPLQDNAAEVGRWLVPFLDVAVA